MRVALVALAVAAPARDAAVVAPPRPVTARTGRVLLDGVPVPYSSPSPSTSTSARSRATRSRCTSAWP